MYVTNTGSSVAVFRDDAGKHFLEPWQSLEITGDQHMLNILTVPGMVAGKLTKPRRPRVVKDTDA